VNAEQLKYELEQIKHPLIVLRDVNAARRVFELYKRYHNEDFPRPAKCMQCAQDCFYVLKYDIKHGTMNGEKKSKSTKQNTMLTKFKLIRPFQVFGDPAYYTEQNLTDKIAMKLLKTDPRLSAFIQRLEPVKTEAPKVEAPKPKAKPQKQ